jgi:hypothetical protein
MVRTSSSDPTAVRYPVPDRLLSGRCAYTIRVGSITAAVLARLFTDPHHDDVSCVVRITYENICARVYDQISTMPICSYIVLLPLSCVYART